MDFRIKIDNLPKKKCHKTNFMRFFIAFDSAYVELFEIAIKIGD